MSVKRIMMWVVVPAWLLLPTAVLAQTEEKVQRVNVLQQVIQLVVKNSPILESQRSLINTIQKMPDPGAGFINFEELQSRSHRVGEEGMGTPLLSLSQALQVETFIQRKLDREKTLAEAKQTYENLKQSLISNLMTKITEMAKLEDKRENLGELKSFLEKRQSSLEKQVKTGIKEPSALFDLMEIVMKTSLEIKNTGRELDALKLETAITLGGEKWEDLLGLLNKI
ncbi:hypothetical protein KAT45_01020 [Candidatus Aerophobetes bacterium]|nr:hypothetical protein [Candidatus Aerophobetes bacterium]